MNTGILSEHTLTGMNFYPNAQLLPRQIPYFRKFVNRFVGADNDLFHNHSSPKRYLYRYPLVQYQSDNGRAVLRGLGETGKAAVRQLLEHSQFREMLDGGATTGAFIAEEFTDTLTLHPSPLHTFRLRDYIALNENNLAAWHDNPSLPARAALLERCLTGHILKFCSAIKWQLPPKSLQVQLLDYRSRTTRAFDNPFLAFDVLFRTNITLPEGIGLGKAVSHGFGVVMSAVK